MEKKGRQVCFAAPSWAAQPACAEGGGTQAPSLAWRHTSSLPPMKDEEKWGALPVGTQTQKDEITLV